MKTTIYLIRHGQTEWNAEKRMQGRLDSPLTDVGVEGATKLAPKMPEVDMIYSSPLGRTKHTAKLVFGERNVVFDERLREIDMGDWEGRLQSDLDTEEDKLHTVFWEEPHRYSKKGAEDIAQVAERSMEFFEEICRRHAGQTVAVVSHTVVIRAILFAIDRRELSEFWKPPAIYPASVSEVQIADGTPSIVRFGCTAHHEHSHSGAY